ncbi:MAG: hypothetical protein ACTHU0_04330 [Kofleriaceae bacterium]
MPSSATELANFQEPMRALVSRSKRIDIRAYEIATADRVAEELQPITLALLGDARALLGAILEVQQAVQPPAGDPSSSAWASHLPFEREIDAAVATKLGSRRAVEEIAFIAQLELRQREDRLGRIGARHGATALLGECDSSLRRVRKALNAVDAAIAKAEDVPPLLDFTSELGTSLAVRRAYAKFRVRLKLDGEPAPEALRARLRAAGTAIAILVGWDAYPEMRVQDRLLLRDLQQRILGWLRGGQDSTAAAGLRLWQDLGACVELFSLINLRQELVAHDAAVVRGLVEAAPSGAALRAALRPLEGLDPELDVLLHAANPEDEREAGALARLAARFARTHGGSS